MARIRTIKPEYWIDEKVVELGPWARLLFIGLWNFADDQGYIDDKPKRIKMQVFPGDNLDVAELLAELVEIGLLDRYDSPVGPVLHVRNWGKHQRIDKSSQPRFAEESRVPASPREDSTNGREGSTNRRESSPSDRGPLATEGNGSGRDLELDLEGIGKPASRPNASRSSAPGTTQPAAPRSVTQRSKTLVDAYAAVEPMSKWPAVNAIVIKAIKTERWCDDEIGAALLRLAAEKRPVTVDSLRVELDGLPPSNGNGVRGSPRLVDHNGLRLKPETVTRLQDRARFAAMDTASLPTAIGGS